MREIKFSILLQHEETGRIVDRHFSYAEIFNGTAKEEIGKLRGYAVIARREYIGFPDKQGKDIYEGDIVRLRLGNDVLEVRWSVLGFRFFNLSQQDWQLIWAADMKRIEIIGDIYENPELMQQQGGKS